MEEDRLKPSESPSLISFVDADIMNGESVVLYSVDIDIKAGDFVYIVGKVGTGKTSIIRTMTAENRLEKGEGKVCGYDLKTLRPKDIPFLRRKLGVVFQDFQLLMDRTVYENLEFVLKATGWKDKEAVDNRIHEVLKDVGMSPPATSTTRPRTASSSSSGASTRTTAPR